MIAAFLILATLLVQWKLFHAAPHPSFFLFFFSCVVDAVVPARWRTVHHFALTEESARGDKREAGGSVAGPAEWTAGN